MDDIVSKFKAVMPIFSIVLLGVGVILPFLDKEIAGICFILVGLVVLNPEIIERLQHFKFANLEIDLTNRISQVEQMQKSLVNMYVAHVESVGRVFSRPSVDDIALQVDYIVKFDFLNKDEKIEMIERLLACLRDWENVCKSQDGEGWIEESIKYQSSIHSLTLIRDKLNNDKKT